MISQSTQRDERQRRFRRCAHCGHVGQVGKDIILVSEYVGGHGYQSAYKCRNIKACWRRWDRAHGLEVA